MISVGVTEFVLWPFFEAYGQLLTGWL